MASTAQIRANVTPELVPQPVENCLLTARLHFYLYNNNQSSITGVPQSILKRLSDDYLYVQCWPEERHHTEYSCLHMSRAFFNPFYCSSCNRNVVYCVNRIMLANMVPIISNMLWKIFDNFPGLQDYQTQPLLSIYNIYQTCSPRTLTVVYQQWINV